MTDTLQHPNEFLPLTPAVFTSRTTGQLMLAVGITGILALLTLILFFVGLFQGIRSLASMGSLNDVLNALTGILSAVLASVVHPALRRLAPRSSLAVLLSAWTGAIAISFGSWLIITGRSDVELSSYYFFFGNGLIGIWLWVLNRIALRQAVWSPGLIRWGLVASTFMMVGLLGTYGILSGSDGGEYSPLVMISGISYLGTGILYPLWCLRLGRSVLSKRDDRLLAT